MANYYDKFDEEANRGVLFDYDISGQALKPEVLTAGEMQQRTDWKAARENLYDHYSDKGPRERNNTPEDVLCERVVPPPLVSHGHSMRYHGGEKRNPKGPRRLHYWNDFRLSVNGFRGCTTTQIKRRHGNVFMSSFDSERGKVNEADEQNFLLDKVFNPLRNAGIFPKEDVLEKPPVHGLIDCNVSDTKRVRLIVEAKSTHSLPLPMTAAQVIARYENGKISGDAASTSEEEQQRIRDKLYVSDTIGQLLRYMLLNGCRYGALTSGTRTYFVRFLDDGRKVAENVYISDPWFVGEQNYVRAWAYIYSLSLDDEAGFFVPHGEGRSVSWALSDDEWSPGGEDEDNPGGGQPRRRSSRRSGGGGDNPETGPSPIQQARYEDIKFEGLLGSGRNGSVLRAKWNGKDVAVKQFDCAREGVSGRFAKEVAAYTLLEEVQGVYVPKAYFVSELPGFAMKYLGLQLGRDPTPEDSFNVTALFSSLEKTHGFVHQDCFRRNTLVITDEDKTERLVAIDLEDYSLRKKERI